MAKEGSTVSGLMDTFATTVSVSLQYGVPLRDLVNKFAHVRFEPSGFTGNPEIPIAKSIVDYIFRWLGSRFLSPDEKSSLGLIDRSAVVESAPSSPAARGEASPASAADSVGRGLQGDVREPRDQPTSTPPSTAGSEAPADDTPKATAVATESVPAEPKAEFAVIAANGHANGHAANGNGNGHAKDGGSVAPITLNLGATKVSFQTQADAPSCADCGSIMVRNGSCYKCLNCGSTSGCS
jgi:ribonucleoside-diphosphate reductase alpha chain